MHSHHPPSWGDFPTLKQRGLRQWQGRFFSSRWEVPSKCKGSSKRPLKSNEILGFAVIYRGHKRSLSILLSLMLLLTEKSFSSLQKSHHFLDVIFFIRKKQKGPWEWRGLVFMGLPISSWMLGNSPASADPPNPSLALLRVAMQATSVGLRAFRCISGWFGKCC